MPAPAAPQLDLFEHSQDTMLRNDVLDALQRRDTLAAQAARRALADLEPQHAALAPLAVLVDTLAAATDAPFSHPGAAAQASAHLVQAVAPAALAQFGAEAAARWLAPCWRQLAERASQLPYRQSQPDDHAAALWLRVGDAAAAQAATQAVAGIESWWRLPAPQAWMAQARYATDGLDATWPLLAEGAWLAAPRLAATLRTLNDPLLRRLLRRFEDDFDPGTPDQAGPGSPDTAHPLAWLPAWLLIEQPALLPRLRDARRGQDSAPERAFWQLVELLGLERQARHAELMASRQRLRDAQPALYAAYMKSR